MRKLALFATFVCLISCYGMNAFGQTSRFVGPGGKTDGAAGGKIAMNTKCITVYAGSHMCTVEEFVETAWLPASNRLVMWAQPSFSNCYYDPGASAATCYEKGLGWASPSDISSDCNEWQSTSGSGTVVSNIAGLGYSVLDSESCANVRNVACCVSE
jgi:hypothetical protein